MVTHGITQILQRKFLVGNDPQRHLLGILLDTCGIRHVGREIIAETIEETPHTGLTITTTREIRFCISGIIGEIGILTLKPTHRTGITYHIVRTNHQVGHRFLAIDGIFLQQVLHLHLHITAIQKLRDTTLVGVRSNRIVRDTDSHPDGTFLRLRTIRTTTHHLQHPSLVGVCNREGLTLGIITILLHERCHHLQSLTGRLRTL